VLFSFTSGVDALHVQHIQLEPISAELFALRAEYDFQRQYEDDLADLSIALEMDPDFARAHWLRAKVLADVGQFRTALKSAEAAVRLEPSSLEYRLTKSHLLAANGQRGEALRQVSQVLAMENLPAQLQAQAECQMGDLLLHRAQPKYKQAMEHHLEAIRLAAPLADERPFAVRRLAKQVLIDAHLAVAEDIVRGNFRRKEEVGPKWVDRARALVEDMIVQEQGDPALRLRVLRTQLAVSAELETAADLDVPAEEAIALGRDLIAAESDSLGQSRIQWELGLVLFEAMRVARLQRDHEAALSYANNAIVQFEQSAPKRQSTPSQKHLIGRLYFLIGTIHAVQIEDHQEAIAWYSKAESILRDAGESEADASVHGERFVSMGVSHWECGAHQKALELTEYGLEIIQLAVKDGSVTSQSLAVPLGNLAAMHSHVGNSEQAEKYASMAARLERPTRGQPIPR
jgi:tetratricopeptide (TPR) repeat protein